MAENSGNDRVMGILPMRIMAVPTMLFFSSTGKMPVVLMGGTPMTLCAAVSLAITS